MIGGMAMLAAMIFLSLLDRRPWWSYPNLLAVNFYGSRVLAAGPGWPTVSGTALQFLIAAIAGAVFGLLFGAVHATARLALLGVGWGLVLFYASAWAYDRATPFIMAYLPATAPMVSHMIYGACLATTHRTAAALTAEDSGQVVESITPVTSVDTIEAPGFDD